jgi:chemotaxis signal transduction protein
VSAQDPLPGTTSVFWQGIHCGHWPLAFSYGWTKSVVEAFSIVPVPKAPAWLIGASNIDGQVSPVVDLALYIDPSAAATVLTKGVRLLVGGDVNDGANETLAIVFNGLPEQLSVADKASSWPHPSVGPLAELGQGYIVSRSKEVFLRLDAPRLLALLSDATV